MWPLTIGASKALVDPFSGFLVGDVNTNYCPGPAIVCDRTGTREKPGYPVEVNFARRYRRISRT